MHLDFISKFEAATVLIVGDIMLDKYWVGDANRISPEAPVPIVSLQKIVERLGGAANVALNIKALGAKPIVCTILGDDVEGQQLLQLFTNQGIDTDSICVSQQRRTTTKTRVIARGNQLLRIDTEDTKDLSDLESQNLLGEITKALSSNKIDVILLQDYNKGVLTKNLIIKVSELASKLDIPVVVDPKFKHFFDYKNTFLFKPNLKEISEALGRSVLPTYDDLKNASKELNQHIKAENILVTLSEHGMFWNNAKKPEFFPTKARKVADVSGAGDTVIALFAVGIAGKIPIETIIQLANIAGGQVCEKVGVVPIDKAELFEEFFQLTTEE